jgi:hypothetical protein
MLAFERIRDREIADEPLCRFNLKSGVGKSESRTQVLRALVLFLRTADRIAGDGLNLVKDDQAAAFAQLDPQMKGAYAMLRAALADAILSPDLTAEDKKQAEALKSLCKQLWQKSKGISKNQRG